MNRLATALGLAVVLVGCTTGMTPPERESSADPTAPVPPPAVHSPLPEAPMPETPLPARTPDASVQRVGLVAYELESRISVVNADGTDVRELLPNEPGSQVPIAWSGDGSRLLYRRGNLGGLALTDAAGSEPDEFDLECPADADDDGILYFCQADPVSVALSPDGTRLAYMIWVGSHDQAKNDVAISIVVMDLPTRVITKLESTQTSRPARACDTSDSRAHRPPNWSPDGTRLAFKRDVPGPSRNSDCREAILTVNADGSDLRQIVPPGQPNSDRLPGWSSDGSLVLDAQGETRMRDGRIVSLRFQGTDEGGGALWIIDADGEHSTPLEATIPSLTAAGCVVCPYPLYSAEGGSRIDPLVARPFQRFWVTSLLWQPVPTGQP